MARFDRLEFDDPPDPREDGTQPVPGSEETDRDAGAWLRRADDHRRRGLYENALRYYSRALEFDKALLAGWVGQVQMLILLGEFPEAELWAKKALELFSGHGDLMAGRAQALARIGDRTRALELADAALRQEGSSAYRWMVRGELFAMTREDIDRHCFDKALGVDNDWLVPVESALIYLFHEQPSNALLRARQGTVKAADRYYAWFVQGNCEQALGFTQQAKLSYDRVLELSPRHLDAGRKLAEIANQGWSLSSRLKRLIGREK